MGALGWGMLRVLGGVRRSQGEEAELRRESRGAAQRQTTAQTGEPPRSGEGHLCLLTQTWDMTGKL